ncbi:MAG TPA: ECF-type sigma factor [Planctomycetaceae bacterium]|nr:ECF-type sigma factor [Planctomycetaceae bacterium]
MSEQTNVNLSDLLQRIQASRDESACAELWRVVYEPLVEIARRRIIGQNRRAADEEDVALSAMNSFIHAAEAGRLNGVTDITDLWRVLTTITARKANAHLSRELAEKRGQGLVRGDSALRVGSDVLSPGFDAIADPGDPHRFVDLLIGECRERIESLPESVLRTIAIKRMEGYEVTEIASQLGIATATVKRKLARIRGLWAADNV